MFSGFFAGANLLRLGLKFWYVPVIAGLALYAWVQYKDVKLAHYERDQAVLELARAVGVNERNGEFIKRQEKAIEDEHKATAQAIADAAAVADETTKAKMELKNAPGANDPAPAYFDVLGDKLRQLGTKGSH